MTEYAPDPDCLFCDGEGVDADPYDRFDYPCYEACPECWPVQKVGTTYGEAAAYDNGVRAGIAEERARIVAWLRVNGLPVARIKYAQVLIDADNFWSVVSAIEAGEHLT